MHLRVKKLCWIATAVLSIAAAILFSAAAVRAQQAPFQTYSHWERDPRGNVISIGTYAEPAYWHYSKTQRLLYTCAALCVFGAMVTGAPPLLRRATVAELSAAPRRHQDRRESRTLSLPRTAAGRIVLGMLALPMCALSGAGVVTSLVSRGALPKDPLVVVLMLLALNFVFAVFWLTAAASIWSIAAPWWIERMLTTLAPKASLAAFLLFTLIFGTLLYFGF